MTFEEIVEINDFKIEDAKKVSSFQKCVGVHLFGEDNQIFFWSLEGEPRRIILEEDRVRRADNSPLVEWSTASINWIPVGRWATRSFLSQNQINNINIILSDLQLPDGISLVLKSQLAAHYREMQRTEDVLQREIMKKRETQVLRDINRALEAL